MTISAFYGTGRKDAGKSGYREAHGKRISVSGSPSQLMCSIHELFEF